MSLQRQMSNITPPLPKFESLPEEILTAIFQYLDATSLGNISSVHERFEPVANSHLLWRNLVLRDFKYWDARHELAAHKADLNFRDWKDLYNVRHTANIATEHAIRLMVDDPVGRLACADKVLDYGYGIKDALIHMYTDAPEECVLAQRYWSHAMLGCVNRALALETWTRIKYRSDIQNPTELALAALDMFMLGTEAHGDIDDTFRRLDEMAAAVRQDCPDIDLQTPRTKAVVIAKYLRQKKWVGIDEGRDYYSIEHQFLGLATRSPHRSSLPLVSCVIYSYVCRQFGLRAQPCSFPMHVHAVVQPGLPADSESTPVDLDGQPLPRDLRERLTRMYTELGEDEEPPHELTHLYIDPFNTHEPISLNTLQQQLNFIDPTASNSRKATYLMPATTRSLLSRSAHNLIRSIRSPATTPGVDISIYDAAYAALFVLVLFAHSAEALNASLNDLRSHFALHFPVDIRNYETYVLPLTGGIGVFGGSRAMQDPIVRDIRRQDSQMPIPQYRNGLARAINGYAADGRRGQQEVKYHIGTVFRHRRQGYVAVIYGWDTKCEMEEAWIMGNGVDRLPEGRAQPFLNAYVEDKSLRYVAQENVVPLGPEEFSAEDAERTFDVTIGKWFRRFDPTTARFISNVRAEYPED
ncbi:hypothetical protein LTR05_004000 [Lithohypha guttulata]|uniref:F-box domain-containing protein n=1 Tax=Lithohypha guttulata TaxID=1690604 RepID=A0AAN7T2M2_9EURO|nr:hypothetical protein LTR05_004000 [Lithohypha guttulata]